MAATIVSTPATGAADWTGWITQQGLTDRGFMQMSLTNFATTAASLIGTGSIFELAGSIYSCTETAISLAAGTISAAVAVYYVAIPSAGGTTCTFTMDSVAPTWVDAKQGYYASAASTSRYLGGSYIGTAATYFSKFIYTPDMILGQLLSSNKTRPLLRDIVEIGDWNMSSTGIITVTIAMKIIRVRGIDVLIINDASTIVERLDGGNITGNANGNVALTGDYVQLAVRDGGAFDDGDHQTTSFNRGWMLIDYEA